MRVDGQPGGMLTLDVPSDPRAVAHTRHAVVDYLRSCGVPAHVVSDMALVASELVTNAIVHGGFVGQADRSVSVSVEAPEAGDRVVLSVSNVGSADDVPPVAHWRSAPVRAASGRGLGIVRRLCDDVIVRQDRERAVVVCRRGAGLATS